MIMKTKMVLSTLALISMVIAGCSPSNGRNGAAISGPVTTAQTPAAPKTGPVRWTLETEVPDDPSERTADSRRRMEEFAQKGWSVLSVRTHTRPQDGKQYRKWELQRDTPRANHRD